MGIDRDVVEFGLTAHRRRILAGGLAAVGLGVVALVLVARLFPTHADRYARQSTAVPSGHPVLPTEATRIRICPTDAGGTAAVTVLVAQTVRNESRVPLRVARFGVDRGAGISLTETVTEPGTVRHGCADRTPAGREVVLGPGELATGTARLVIDCGLASVAWHSEAHWAVGSGRVLFTVSTAASTGPGDAERLDVTPAYSQEWSWLVDVVGTACRL
jgi:hypothetical protein